MRLAPAMTLLAKVASPAVWLLDVPGAWSCERSAMAGRSSSESPMRRSRPSLRRPKPGESSNLVSAQ